MTQDVTSNRISGLESLIKGHGGKGPPPVEKWNPPYCGDIGMAIKADGTWFYAGTPIGRLPKPGEIDITGLDVTPETMTELFRIDNASWLAEADLTGEYFTQFGDKVPAEITAQLDALKARLQA